MREADVLVILSMIPDCMCLAMRPQMMKVDGMLEELMPDEDVPEGAKVTVDISNIKPLTYDQKDMIVSLFDNISVVHEHFAHAAEMMSSLCKVMDLQQLILIMQCSIHPLMQLNASPGLFNSKIHKEKNELPDDRRDRVHETMIPNPNEKGFKNESEYNATRLLAATLAFYIDRMFGKQCIMIDVQKKFVMRTKQLSLCIMGQKYFSGTGRKSQLREET